MADDLLIDPSQWLLVGLVLASGFITGLIADALTAAQKIANDYDNTWGLTK